MNPIKILSCCEKKKKKAMVCYDLVAEMTQHF